MNRNHSPKVRADVRAFVFEACHRQGIVNVTLIADEVRLRNAGEDIAAAEAERLVMLETMTLDVPMVFSREPAAVSVQVGPDAAAIQPLPLAAAICD